LQSAANGDLHDLAITDTIRHDHPQVRRSDSPMSQ
jgi:hypothetical protein